MLFVVGGLPVSSVPLRVYYGVVGRVTRCFSSFSGFPQFILSLFPGGILPGIVVKDSPLVLKDWDGSLLERLTI